MTYTIDDDEEGYTRFIKELRSTVTSHQYQAAGVLPRPGDGPMWWNIQLKVAGNKKKKLAGNKKETSTTLALRGDDLRICGFRSHKDNRWYQIGHECNMFEQEYDAFSISMNSDSMYWPSMTKGKTAATARNAVDALSHYQLPPGDHWPLHLDGRGTDGIGLPLMTLQLMVSYSASIIDVHDAVRQGWLKGVPKGKKKKGWQLKGMTAQRDDKLLDLMSFWDGLSISALEQWEHRLHEWEHRRHRLHGAVRQGWLLNLLPLYRGDFDNKLLERIGIKNPQGALEVFALIKDAGRDRASTGAGWARSLCYRSHPLMPSYKFTLIQR